MKTCSFSNTISIPGRYAMNGVSFHNKIKVVCLCIAVFLFSITILYSFKEREHKKTLENKEFFVEETYISSTQEPLANVIEQLSNKQAWHSFLSQHKEAYIYIDPRSGRPVSLMYPYPLIPGSGDVNSITFKSLSAILGYKVNT